MDTRKLDSGINGARVCPQCGAAFTCGLAAGDSSIGGVGCWCCDLPPVMPVRAPSFDATACLCPACLTQAIRQAQEVQ